MKAAEDSGISRMVWAVRVVGTASSMLVGLGLFVLLTRAWTPVFDTALIWLRSTDVGTWNTPLVGPYSRFGWSHPGPALYYAMALPLRLLGLRPTALLVGAFLIAMASVTVLMLLVWRRAGAGASLVLGVALAVLIVGLDAHVIEPWNPYVLVMPFALLMGASWMWSTGEDRALPWVIGAGSFAVQSHVGVAPAAIAIGAVAIILRLTASPDSGRRSKASIYVSAVLAVFLWAPPLWQQLATTDGNLGHIAQFFFDAKNKEPALGWRTGLGIAAEELAPWGSLVGRQQLGFMHEILPASEFVLALPIGSLLLAFVVAKRRHDDVMLRLVPIIAIALFACVYGFSHIHGLPFPYLVAWPRVVAAFCFSAPLMVFTRRWSEGRVWNRYQVQVRSLAVFGLAALLSVRAMTATLPDALASQIHLRFASAVEDAWPPGTSGRVVASGTPFTVSSEALAIMLLRAGRQPRLQPADTGVPGSHRCTSADAVLPTLLLASGAALDDARQLAGAEPIAEHDPLSRADRAAANHLRDRLAQQLREGHREDLIIAMEDGAEWLPIAAPPNVDKKMLADYLKLAGGDLRRAFALFRFAPTRW